jgi:uncharacterized membrane protein YfcA
MDVPSPGRLGYHAPMWSVHFEASGVDVFPLIPFLVAFVVSTITSMGGVSGAFVLLPFQVSVLGFTGPAVTPTNHLFNVVAIPSGVYRYVRERRMLWPLAWVIIVGTVPGVVAGSLARIYLLPDPRNFKLFMGLVLLFIGGRLLKKVWTRSGAAKPAASGQLDVKVLRFDWRAIEYEYESRTYRISIVQLAALTAVIGVIGGAYGVGGGSIIAPFLVTLFGLPVHTIAGAALLGTCLTSIVGVGFFALMGPWAGKASVGPDWALGVLFGLGGVCGMYTGARLQKRIPARAIEIMLAVIVVGLGISYIAGFFLRR